MMVRWWWWWCSDDDNEGINTVPWTKIAAPKTTSKTRMNNNYLHKIIISHFNHNPFQTPQRKPRTTTFWEIFPWLSCILNKNKKDAKTTCNWSPSVYEKESDYFPRNEPLHKIRSWSCETCQPDCVSSEKKLRSHPKSMSGGWLTPSRGELSIFD